MKTDSWHTSSPCLFQEGKPLAITAEELIELVEASSDELISRQVLMAEEGKDDGLSPIETLDMISEDEATTNAGDENDTEREARRARNRARAARRRRVNERIQSMHHELDIEFAVVSERGFRTPMANIARVTAILEPSNDPNLRQALRYAPRAWIQLNRQNPASTIGEEHMGESRSQANSRTQAAVNEAITTTTLVEVRPLAGGSNHIQEATRDNLIIPTIGILKTYSLKTCVKKINEGRDA
jgi:hypothetical protein